MARPNTASLSGSQSVRISPASAPRIAATALVLNLIPATKSIDPVLECGVRTDPFNVPSLGATARYVSSDPSAVNEYIRRIRSE